jgi:TonB family protein
LLADLLDSGAPPELKRLSAEQVGAGSIADFRRALGFFERPSKDKDLRALAARVAEADDKAHLQTELDRLTREARNAEHTPAEAHPAVVVRATGLRKLLIATAAVAAVVAALGALVIVLMQGTAGSPAVAAGVGASTESGFLERVRDRVRSTLAAEPSEPKQTTVASPAPARVERHRPRQTIDPVIARTLEAPETFSEPRQVTEAAIPVLPSFGTWTLDVPLPALRESHAVYDAGASEVIAATLVRPQLPAVDIPGLAGNRLGSVMIVVDPQGRVEQVRLLKTTPERRYYDAMILAAIKAWTFKPATRAGQAVRYRLVLPLT